MCVCNERTADIQEPVASSLTPPQFLHPLYSTSCLCAHSLSLSLLTISEWHTTGRPTGKHEHLQAYAFHTDPCTCFISTRTHVSSERSGHFGVAENSFIFTVFPVERGITEVWAVDGEIQFEDEWVIYAVWVLAQSLVHVAACYGTLFTSFSLLTIYFTTPYVPQRLGLPLVDSPSQSDCWLKKHHSTYMWNTQGMVSERRYGMLFESNTSILPTFDIRLQNRSDRLSLVSCIHGDAPFPLGLGLHYPTYSDASAWLTETLQSRVARRNLVGFDSMVPGRTALWPLGARRTLLLRLVYIRELWLGPASHLLAMIGEFTFGVHLIGRWWRGNGRDRLRYVVSGCQTDVHCKQTYRQLNKERERWRKCKYGC